MSNFSVTILGSNSSIPTLNRGLTSQIVGIRGQYYMIDCGEGTQLQLTKFNIRRNKIKVVFVSHLHGDHLYGLPGFITSFSQLDRKKPLKIFGPVGIKKYLETIFELSQVYLPYTLEIQECNLTDSRKIYEDDFCKVFNFPLNHRVPTQGFVFFEKTNPFRLDINKINQYQLSIDQIKKIKSGDSLEINHQTYPPEFFCKLLSEPKKYVFVSDTSPLSEFPEFLNNSDLMYHEATYLHELEQLAIERGHSTSVHAAQFANKIKAKKLLLGHFSSRYHELGDFQKEACEIFENTIIAIDGRVYDL